MPRNGTAFDEMPRASAERMRADIGAAEEIGWSLPDMGVLRLYRRPPPPLPLGVFGPWDTWLAEQAEAAACPVDYVAGPLLAAVSALIGNARWPQAGGSWSEPPHLWAASVGDSGTGKSPGGDGLLGKVLPVVEHNMRADFPDLLQEWKASAETVKAREEQWRSEVRDAQKAGKAPPPPPPPPGPEPQEPRLRQNDVTIERVASLLATWDSVMPKHDRISPSSSGLGQRSCCSGVPNWTSTSMLPVSGAARCLASGAIAMLRPMISASGA